MSLETESPKVTKEQIQAAIDEFKEACILIKPKSKIATLFTLFLNYIEEVKLSDDDFEFDKDGILKLKVQNLEERLINIEKAF